MQAFTVLLVASLALAATAVPTGRVVGGDDAEEGQFKYQVSLRKPDGSHFCGGSIINKRYILTAAHCVLTRSASYITVTVGSNSLRAATRKYSVEKVIPHEGFNVATAVNDIALLRLTADIEYSENVQPIAVADTEPNCKNYDVVLSGWGRLSAKGKAPDHLQFVNLKAISVEECKKFWSVDYTHLCTFTKVGEGACMGDSGGPLVHNGMQVGVVSLGRPCAVGIPDVFTRVAAFKSWIESHIH